MRPLLLILAMLIVSGCTAQQRTNLVNNITGGRESCDKFETYSDWSLLNQGAGPLYGYGHCPNVIKNREYKTEFDGR